MTPAYSAIVIATARAFGLDPALLVGPAGRNDLVRARAAGVVVMRALHSPRTGQRKALPTSYPVIAEMFGLKTHHAIMYLEQKAEAFAGDPAWCAARDDIAADIADRIAGRAARPLPPEPRHPAALAKRVHPKNEPAANDGDALARFRGAQALIAAIAREHPERVLAERVAAERMVA